jgi:DNA-binding CsgD family transcriptional regulator
MAQVSQRDLRAISEFIEELHSSRTLDAHAASVVHGIPRIIGCDVCTFNEINPQRRRVQWIANTVRDIPNSREICAQHMHEHPFVRHWNSGYGTHQAAKLSDFVGRRQWRDRGLYTEFYRPFEVEHMLGVALPAPRPRELHVLAFRKKLDFDERDRRVLDLLSPHFSAAYANAEVIADLEGQLTALRRGLETSGRTVVQLGPGRRIRQMSERAQDWLNSYFSSRWSDRTMLPPPLDEWVRRQQQGASKTDSLAAPRRPLVAERDGNRLTVRMLSERDGLVLLLSERKLRIAPEDLASLGLSPRETEVLTWLTRGESNGAIAESLGLAPATIKHCIERIYLKLEVGTRAAATAIAVATAGAGD